MFNDYPELSPKSIGDALDIQPRSNSIGDAIQPGEISTLIMFNSLGEGELFSKAFTGPLSYDFDIIHPLRGCRDVKDMIFKSPGCVASPMLLTWGSIS